MTIKELIDKVQEEKPNTFANEKIISFINEIEPEVAEQLCVGHEKDYTEDDMDTKLLAERPYDRLYVSYVKSQIDYANEEYASYQLNAEQHVQDFRDFTNWVVRTRQALGSTFPTRLRNIL